MKRNITSNYTKANRIQINKWFHNAIEFSFLASNNKKMKLNLNLMSLGQRFTVRIYEFSFSSSDEKSESF